MREKLLLKHQIINISYNEAPLMTYIKLVNIFELHPKCSSIYSVTHAFSKC